MKQQVFCQLCNKDITSLPKFNSDISLTEYPQGLPRQLYVALECKDVWRNKEDRCKIDDINITLC